MSLRKLANCSIIFEIILQIGGFPLRISNLRQMKNQSVMNGLNWIFIMTYNKENKKVITMKNEIMGKTFLLLRNYQ